MTTHYTLFAMKSFNPCYNGNKVERKQTVFLSILRKCFNPCYKGNKVEQ